MNDADRDIVGRMQHRVRDARLVAEAVELHTKGKSGYDIQLDEDAIALIESQSTEIKRLKASLKSMEASYVARANMQ